MLNILVKVKYDGSRLALPADEEAPIIEAWTSLVGRRKHYAPVIWSDAARTKSQTVGIALTVPYASAEARKALAYVMPLDSTLGFQVKVCTVNPQGEMSMTNAGAALYPLAQRIVAGKGVPAPEDVDLCFYTFWEGDSKQVVKGQMRILSIDIVDAQSGKPVSVRVDRTVDEFAYVDANRQLFASVSQTVMARAIAMFTEDATANGYSFAPSSEEVRRVHFPFYHSPAGTMPGFVYAVGGGQSPPTAGTDRHARVQTWLRKLLHYSLRRENWTHGKFVQVIDAQLARTDAEYDRHVTMAAEIVGQALVIPATSMPYVGDNVNTGARGSSGDWRKQRSAARRLLDSIRSSNGYVAASKTELHSIERASEMIDNDGGDCEDGGHFAVRIADMLIGGTWTDATVRSAAALLRQYVPSLNLGSVRSAALGNDSDRASSDADIIDSTSDRAAEYGAHMWGECVPLQKFRTLVRRGVDTGLRVEQHLSQRGAVDAPWTVALPHLVLEGTGRMSCLQLPAPAYVIGGSQTERQAESELRRTWINTVASLQSRSKALASMSLVRKQPALTYTPNKRTNLFYRDTTSMFSRIALQNGYACLNFMYAQVGRRVAADASEGKFFEHSKLDTVLLKAGCGFCSKRRTSDGEDDETGTDDEGNKPANPKNNNNDEDAESGDEDADKDDDDDDADDDEDDKASESSSDTRSFDAFVFETKGMDATISPDALSEFMQPSTAVMDMLDCKARVGLAERMDGFEYGVPMHDKIQQVPLPATAIVPGTPLSSMEARVFATMMRNSPPLTLPGDWEGPIEQMHRAKFAARKALGYDDAADENAEERIFSTLRNRLDVASGNPEGRRWLVQVSDAWTLVALFFPFHSLRNAAFVDTLVDDIATLHRTKFVGFNSLTSEEPVPHRRFGCLRLLCRADAVN